MDEQAVKTILEGYRREFRESGFGEECKVGEKTEQFVRMSDGTNLHTIVGKPEKTYLEKRGGKIPVIIQRTCYPDMEPLQQVVAEEFTKRGYGFVYQYCRGTGKSEGVWEPNVNERQDGIDTVDWLANEAWIDGIGFWGYSYSALAGWAIADAVADKVTSMCLSHYGTDRYVSAYEKGMFRHDILTSWTMDNAGFQIDADYMESCKFMPHEEVDHRLWGQEIPWYREYVTNTKITDQYWQNGWWKTLREIPSKVSIPIYMMSGYYDHHHGSSMVTWERLNEAAKEKSWLRIGPWNHGFQTVIAGRETKHVNASERTQVLLWFDLTLKQKQIPKKKIEVYEVGADRWITLDSFEQPNMKRQKFYLEARNMQIVSSVEKGTECGSASYEYDPGNPVESYGCESMFRDGSKNGSLLEPVRTNRADVLSFLSEPLEQELILCGKTKVTLYVTSTAADTAFTAKLYEVTKEDKVYNIRSSITTIAADLKKENSYDQGTVTSVDIDMWDIVYRIPAGHRIRLDVPSSDFPQYHIHSNYAGIWSKQRKKQVAVQTILTGGRYESVIEIKNKLP